MNLMKIWNLIMFDKNANMPCYLCLYFGHFANNCPNIGKEYNGNVSNFGEIGILKNALNSSPDFFLSWKIKNNFFFF